jgi:hypothetical protein
MMGMMKRWWNEARRGSRRPETAYDWLIREPISWQTTPRLPRGYFVVVAHVLVLLYRRESILYLDKMG